MSQYSGGDFIKLPSWDAIVSGSTITYKLPKSLAAGSTYRVEVIGDNQVYDLQGNPYSAPEFEISTAATLGNPTSAGPALQNSIGNLTLASESSGKLTRFTQSDYAGASFQQSRIDSILGSAVSEEVKQFLAKYKLSDPSSPQVKKSLEITDSVIDFTAPVGSLKSLIAEVALNNQVKATAAVKVNPTTGKTFDFTYDPATGLGVELLDLDKNGLVDTLRYHLRDGEIGDVDGVVNGVIRDPVALAEAPRLNVYRFYRNGVHFYTTSEVERDNVIKNSYASGIGYADLSANPQSKDPITGGGWGYRYESVAYQALDTQGTALYRFFSPSKGYHFVTTNAAEALNVIKNSVGSSYDLSNAQGQKLLDNGWGYQFEGNTYKVSTIAQTGMDQPVYRFFNGTKGVHFYSSSMAEAKSVIANSLGAQYATDSWVTSTADALKQNPLTSTPAPLATGWGYSFEGIAWYV